VRWLLLLLSPAALLAQGTDPRPKPEDYEAHGQTAGAAIGAEFMIHSFSGRGITYLAPDYLVVEVALYPPAGASLEVVPGAFSLRLNGKKGLLSPAATTMVAASLQHPEWQTPPHLQAGAGVGNSTVILGAPRQSQTPYPSDPRSAPPRPRPQDSDPDGLRTPPVKAEELVVETALPEGQHRGPVSGFLYFPFRGKAGSLKTVELLFEDAVIKLR